MMKREFEQTYRRKVSDSRWAKIEKAYMESDCIDRLDFVAEVKAKEKEARFKKQAANGSFEVQRHGVTEAQFRAYVRNCLKGHPLEGWRDSITPDLGHGDWEYRESIHEDGAREINVDKNGKYQTYLLEPNGNCYNFIFEFDPYDDDGHGSGYCYIFDNSTPGYVPANRVN